MCGVCKLTIKRNVSKFFVYCLQFFKENFGFFVAPKWHLFSIYIGGVNLLADPCSCMHVSFVLEKGRKGEREEGVRELKLEKVKRS